MVGLHRHSIQLFKINKPYDLAEFKKKVWSYVPKIIRLLMSHNNEKEETVPTLMYKIGETHPERYPQAEHSPEMANLYTLN